MSNLKQPKIHLMKKIFLLLLLVKTVNSFSQLNYQAANATNAAGTYTDLAATGTAITTNFAGGAMTFDDENSSVQNIGFDFSYNSSTFTQFVLNTNGFIILGNAAPSANNIFYTTFNGVAGGCIQATDNNLIYVFNHDLQGGTSPEFRVATTGSAPNRVCIIQYKNMADKIGTTQYANMNFQIKLYEGSNKIEFVYGTWTANANASAFNSAAVGIKGTGAATSVNATKGSTGAWSTTTFVTGDYTGNAHNYGNGTRPAPDAGRTYTFFPTYANDLSVTRVETFGKIPTAFGFPHAIKASIKNTGTNAIAAGTVVSLNVSGANVFADTKLTSALASGASQLITFTPIGDFVAGNNTVTVSIPTDDNNSNNSATMTQLVNGIAFSYADNAAVTGALGYNTGSGIIATKYGVQSTAFVTNVKVFIGNNSATTGNTVYAVVMNAAGTIVGQSANYVVLATDLNTFKNFTITTPPSFSFADFYVGLAQTANTVTGYFPVGTQSEASPTRSGAYYTAPLAGGVAPTESTTNGRFVIEALLSNTSTPVPLSLTSFNGKLVNETAQLNWSTSNEVNTDKFELERTGFASVNWSKIASLNAAGYSSSSKHYQITDPNLSIGKYLYRLKMVDKDGKFTYSNIVTLELSGKNLFVLNQNYPNPVKGTTQLSYQLNTDAKVNIDLFSIDGKRIATLVNESQNTGTYNFTLDCKKYSLAPGNYTYKMIVTDKNNQPLFNAAKTLIVVQ